MLRSPNRTPQNYKEKFSKHDFFKKRGQNILKLTDSVEKGQNFWNLGVSIGETFFGLTVPSQTMCTRYPPGHPTSIAPHILQVMT